MICKILINGKFLAQRTTGVQRYAREILKSLDALLPVCRLAVFLAVPKDAQDIPNFKNIRIVYKNKKASIFWDQIWMPLYALSMKAHGLHLCTVGPVVKPDFVFLHDTNVQVNSQWFTKKVILWYSFIYWFCCKRAKKIFTVSNFSKNELQRIYCIPDNRIDVIGAGWQHINEINTAEESLGKFNLQKKRFFFSLGTKAPHKNMQWILKYAAKHPNEQFAISGSTYGKIFGKIQLKELPNVHFLGYLSDSEVKTLMRNCKAFLFPSFYEGFGIPPLEALSLGTPIVVSDIPVMREIFGTSARYIDPADSDVDLNALINEPVASECSILENYSWDKSARKLLENLEDFYQ